MRTSQTLFPFMAVVLMAAAAVAEASDGLSADAETLMGPRWQARLSVGGSAPHWRSSLGGTHGGGLKVESLAVMGDYYFSSARLSESAVGGFRASSGVLLGPRHELTLSGPRWAASGNSLSLERRGVAPSDGRSPELDSDTTALPYLGIGYSSLSRKSGWSLNADLGIVALHPGNAVKLGRVANGSQALDEMLRDLRLSPVLQLGVSYSF